jgi:hypothetical protein
VLLFSVECLRSNGIANIATNEFKRGKGSELQFVQAKQLTVVFGAFHQR